LQTESSPRARATNTTELKKLKLRKRGWASLMNLKRSKSNQTEELMAARKKISSNEPSLRK